MFKVLAIVIVLAVSQYPASATRGAEKRFGEQYSAPVDCRPLDGSTRASLREMLETKNAATQISALDAIGEFGPDAAPLVPQLTQLLDDANSDVRRHTLQALARIGPPAAPAVDAIVGLLESDNESDVFWSQYALGQNPPGTATKLAAAIQKNSGRRVPALIALRGLGPQGAPAIGPLLDLLQNDIPEDERLLALAVIGSIGPAAGTVFRDLLHLLATAQQDAVRRSILEAIVKTSAPGNSPAADHLRPLVMSRDAEVRILAAQGLLRIDAEDRTAIRVLIDEFASGFPELLIDSFQFASEAATPQILEALQSRDERIRRLCLLVVIGWPQCDMHLMIPAVLTKLTDPDANVRYAAASIVAMHPLSKLDEVQQVVAAIEREPEKHIQQALLRALEATGTTAETALPRILPLCSEAEAGIRSHAIRAATSIGPDAPAVFDALSRALDDPDPHVRSTAVSRLTRYAGALDERVVARVIKLLADTDSYTRWSAATTLGEIRVDSQLVVPALEQLNSDPEASLRIAAALAIAHLRPDHPSGIESLIREVEQTRHDMSRAGDFGSACEALASLGPAAVAAVPALKLLRGSCWRMRIKAVIALHRITGDREFFTDLIEALDVPDVATSAIRALAEIGPPTRVALPLLMVKSQSSDPFVRKVASNAISRIAPDDNAVVARLRQLSFDPAPDVRMVARRALSQAEHQTK